MLKGVFGRNASFAVSCQILLLSVLCLNAGVRSQENDSPSPAASSNGNEPHRPGFPDVTNDSSNSSPLIIIGTSVDDIITPSDTCKEIVGRFAAAISSFTQCSVSNSRPIHLCEWCSPDYLKVIACYQELLVTVDEKGNTCKEYFTNLDRIEIVSDAYTYVRNLWFKGRCDYCFKKGENGTMKEEITDDVSDFNDLYELTKSCFNKHLNGTTGADLNQTCLPGVEGGCRDEYENLTEMYITLSGKYGDNLCMDVVDTMNTTRDLWSVVFRCTPKREFEVWLHIGMTGILGLPVLFYFLTYICGTRQDARVFRQRRLAEIVASQSVTTGGSVNLFPYTPRRQSTYTRSTSMETSEPPADTAAEVVT